MIEPVLRTLAPQRSISLYKDQEEDIERILKENGLSSTSVSSVIRKGVDLLIQELNREGKLNG